MAAETRSSPPPPPPDTRRTPVPQEVRHTLPSYPEAEALVVGRAETPGERALRITLENRRQIGRPPVEAAGEPGSGLWAVLAKLNDKMGKVVAWTEAEDEARKSRGGMLAVIGREILRGAIPLIVLAVSAYLAGFHR